MTTIACPHTSFGYRACPGCTAHGADDAAGLVCCASDGEITATVTQDSDGDGAWVTLVYLIEGETADCGCVLSEVEWERARELLIEGYVDDDPHGDAAYYGAMADARSY